MAKEKFERNKPHVNIGTIGHVGPWQDHPDRCYHQGADTWRAMQSSWIMPTSTRLPKRESAALPSTPLTLSIRLRSVTMHTLTAPATPTM